MFIPGLGQGKTVINPDEGIIQQLDSPVNELAHELAPVPLPTESSPISILDLLIN